MSQRTFYSSAITGTYGQSNAVKAFRKSLSNSMRISKWVSALCGEALIRQNSVACPMIKKNQPIISDI